MNKQHRVLGALAAAAILGLLAGFAVLLSDTQAKSRSDVVDRVRERASITSGLIDGLFESAAQSPQNVALYGGATVRDQTLEANRGGNNYVVLLDPAGRLMASSKGVTPAAREQLMRSQAAAFVRKGGAYGFGNVRAYGTEGVVNFAVPVETSSGRRILVSGFKPAALQVLVEAQLRKIPGVTGSRRFLIDGRGRVVASTDPKQPSGTNLPAARMQSANSFDSGDTHVEQTPLANSPWRVRLVAPEKALFASVSGLRKWVPWMIFVGFALAATAAFVLARRAFASAARARRSSEELAGLNGQLEETNVTLNRRAAELARSNDELDQFASIASHDLQEPLRKVRTFTERVTVMESEHLSEKGLDYLERTNAAAERMQRLVEDLLAFSRVSSRAAPFVELELDDVAREVLLDLDDALERSGGEVRIGTLPRVHGDPSQLRQLLQNLIANGLKFQREGVSPVVSVDAEVAGDVAILTVRDNGIGFEKTYAERIFRVFERLHGRSEYAGTGIGLAICRKIAERHGGTIVAEGHPGEGAAFIVTLPVGQREEVIVRHSADVHDAAERREEEPAHA